MQGFLTLLLRPPGFPDFLFKTILSKVALNLIIFEALRVIVHINAFPTLPASQVGLVRLDLDLLTIPDLSSQVLMSNLELEWGVRRGEAALFLGL